MKGDAPALKPMAFRTISTPTPRAQKAVQRSLSIILAERGDAHTEKEIGEVQYRTFWDGSREPDRYSIRTCVVYMGFGGFCVSGPTENFWQLNFQTRTGDVGRREQRRHDGQHRCQPEAAPRDPLHCCSVCAGAPHGRRLSDWRRYR